MRSDNGQDVLTRTVHMDPDGIGAVLRRLDESCFLVDVDGRIGATSTPPLDRRHLVAVLSPCPPRALGAESFRAAYGVRAAYVAGAMARGIASVKMVRAMADVGLLASFGSGGLPPTEVERALAELRDTLGRRSYLVNMLHAPQDRALEARMVDLFGEYGVRAVEASAFIGLTPDLVRYRLSGLSRRGNGIVVGNRLVAKVSRLEVGRNFMAPAPAAIVSALRDSGTITAEQAELARSVPMADEITVEADSGGHTDGRPLVVLLPEFLHERETLRRRWPPAGSVRVGAAGGLGTPYAVAAAFALGADYVVTGSVNQASLEADLAGSAKTMLAAAGSADFAMAPAADMFEMGAQVQVLRRGTMFAQRGQRLKQLYDRYESLEDLTDADRKWLESTVLRSPIEVAWRQVTEYLATSYPALLASAEEPRRKMALLFRWYLGMSSRWAQHGDAERVVDYQLWAGPALGAFNDWAEGSCLSDPRSRTVTEIAANLMAGAAYLTRVNQLRAIGVRLPSAVTVVRPVPDCVARLGNRD
ncbi:PfaD family polyunsaturated fatty acid/polyketide biosynthesis protein [Nocardia lijiangensis]|uniref:PfaD family polyunsaturated fatty acid/polyketide biosynthesis protein n=1 Tax=Nocardia lijiangensis TaxID=299618 RepID=UPI003D716CB1